MTTIFRDFLPEDFNELSALWQSVAMGGAEREDTLEIIEDTLKRGGKLLLLTHKEDREIIGSSWMTFDGRRMSLHHFCIREDYQRQGFGTLLAKESLRYIKDKGYQVKLEVHKQNIKAKRLYEKLGFFAFTDYDIYMIRKVNEIHLS